MNKKWGYSELQPPGEKSVSHYWLTERNTGSRANATPFAFGLVGLTISVRMPYKSTYRHGVNTQTKPLLKKTRQVFEKILRENNPIDLREDKSPLSRA